MTGSRKDPIHHGDADWCEYCTDTNGDDVCDKCGRDMDDHNGGCPCDVPIGETPWLIMVIIVMAYALHKARQRRDSDVQDGHQMVA